MARVGPKQAKNAGWNPDTVQGEPAIVRLRRRRGLRDASQSLAPRVGTRHPSSWRRRRRICPKPPQSYAAAPPPVIDRKYDARLRAPMAR
jgi:hypothetical protein